MTRWGEEGRGHYISESVRRDQALIVAQYGFLGIFHFTFWSSPQHFLLHFPTNLLHFPIKFASFPQKNASFPQQNAAFPQQIASFTQPFAAFPHAILCHFANLLKPDFTKHFQFLDAIASPSTYPLVESVH